MPAMCNRVMGRIAQCVVALLIGLWRTMAGHAKVPLAMEVNEYAELTASGHASATERRPCDFGSCSQHCVIHSNRTSHCFCERGYQMMPDGWDFDFKRSWIAKQCFFEQIIRDLQSHLMLADWPVPISFSLLLFCCDLLLLVPYVFAASLFPLHLLILWAMVVVIALYPSCFLSSTRKGAWRWVEPF